MHALDIARFAQCPNNCTLRYLESLAMLGLAIDVTEENCPQSRFRRIVVRLVNDTMVTSACYLEDEIKQSAVVIKTYIEIAKKNNAIGGLRIVELPKSD